MDIAREAGVSQATVSLILNEVKGVSFHRDTIERVRKVAEALNYRPNIAARSISTRRAYSLGVISRWDTASPFFSRPLRGMLAVTHATGYSLTLCDVEVDSATLETALDRAATFYREGRIDGVIAILATMETDVLSASSLRSLSDANIPLVLVNACTQDSFADQVSTDNFHAGHLGTSHLIRLGRKKIAFFLERTGRERTSSAETERLKGYMEALKEHGDEGSAWVIRAPYAPISFETGYRTFQRVLRSGVEPPDALYAINDFLALGAMQAAQEAGLRIPEDLAVVGTDDYLISKGIRPSLTSVRQPLKQLGTSAARLLLERIDGRGPDHRVNSLIPCEIVVRESCGADNGAATQSS